VEILPTLARAIPFENAGAWQQQADLYQQPETESEVRKEPTP
jgi:hypothetical protein